MHPNAGTQLLAEITLLPNVLQNPSSSIGDSYTPDHVPDSPLPTNISHSTARDLMISGENPDEFGSNSRNSRRHFMCRSLGDSTELRGDRPSEAVAPAAASSSGLVEIPLPGATTTTGAAGAGSSAVSSSPATSSSPHVAAQWDPATGSLTPNPVGSSAAPLGSAMASPDAAPAVSLAPPSQQGPVTRLQRGISKSKIYTDGIVRWGMLANHAAKEPTSVEQALGDSVTPRLRA